MKTKILLAVAMIGAASLSAQAGVHFGLSIGLPVPVVTYSAPVYTQPEMVVAPACPPPAVVTTAYVTTPPCPGPDYAWVAGYWSVGTYGRVWVPGCWQYRAEPVVVARFGDGYGHDRDGQFRRDGGDDRRDHGDDRRYHRDGGDRR